MMTTSKGPAPIRELTVLTFVESGTFELSETIELDLGRNYIQGFGVQQLHSVEIDDALRQADKAQRAIIYLHASYEGIDDHFEPLAGRERIGELINKFDDRQIPWGIIAMNPPKADKLFQDASFIVTRTPLNDRQLKVFYSPDFQYGIKLQRAQ